MGKKVIQDIEHKSYNSLISYFKKGNIPKHIHNLLFNVLSNYNLSEDFLEALLIEDNTICCFDDLENTLIDLKEASILLKDYIINNKKICIVTDYDSDGLNSAAMSYKFFKDIFNYSNYKVIHNELKYGYGINDTLVDILLKEDIDLIITMDHGIANEDSFKKIKEQKPNIKIIVTDHHIIQDELYPNSADMVINNKRKDNCKDIEASGCLIGFILLYNTYRLLYNKGYIEDINIFSDVMIHVGVSLVTDVIPVDNRLVRYSLKEALKFYNNYNGKYHAWYCLKEILNIPRNMCITEEDIGFKIGPILNLGKRTGSCSLVYRLLITETLSDAFNHIQSLFVINNVRKRATTSLIKMINDNINVKDTYGKVITISSEFNISGVISSSLANQYNIPVICFNNSIGDDKVLEGSGRTANDIDLLNILKNIQEKDENIFIRLGGHKEAIGCTISLDKLDIFKKMFNEEVYKEIKRRNISLEKEFEYIEINKIDTDTLCLINKILQPYGKNFNKPLYISTFRVEGYKKYPNYVIFNLMQGSRTFKGFVSLNDESYEKIKNTNSNTIRAIFSLHVNELMVKDHHSRYNVTSEDTKISLTIKKILY